MPKQGPLLRLRGDSQSNRFHVVVIEGHATVIAAVDQQHGNVRGASEVDYIPAWIDDTCLSYHDVFKGKPVIPMDALVTYLL